MHGTIRKKRILATLGGGVSLPFGGLVSLTNLVSYWKLDEPSGTRTDSHGTNHLTPINTPPAVVGIIGNGNSFNGSSQRLRIASNASLQPGATFTFSCWVKGTAPAGYFIARDDVGSREYHIGFSGSNIRFEINGAGALISTATISPNVWHLVICWRDNTTGQSSIQIDNGIITSGASPVPNVTGVEFAVGALSEAAAYYTGSLDEIGFWKRALTPAERTALYNGGAGRTY